MLFYVLQKLIALNGLNEALRQKIDLLFALDRLNNEQYKQLIDD